MRHGKTFNHLSRTASHRRALLSNMASSLIIHKRITTTVAKAKALRQYVEPLLTKAKTDNTHSRRIVFGYLQNKDSVKELFSAVADKIATRNGGYTRILKLGNRPGDNAEMAIIELVDYNELMLQDRGTKTEKAAKPGRTRRGKKTVSAKTEDAPAKTAKPKAESKAKAEGEAKEAKPKAKKAEKPAEDKNEAEGTDTAE